MKPITMLIFFHISLISAVYAGDKYQTVFNQEYYPTLEQLITNAQKSICIIAFSMDSSKPRLKAILNDLKNAKSRGVNVQVILEGNEGSLGRNNKKTLTVLLDMGISAIQDSHKRITHAKLVIVDEQYVLIGATNLTQNSMDNNNESNLLVQSSDAGVFYKEYFDKLWQHSEDILPHMRVSKDGESVYFTDTKYVEIATNAIDGAKKEIDLMMYMVKMDIFNPNQAVSQLLNRLIAAKRRGVTVKLVLEQTYPGAFNAHIYGFNKYAASFLYDNGVRDIVFDDPAQITHSKILLIDNEQVIIGSDNWYESDLLYNHQTGILTRNKDAVHGTKEYFENIYKKYQK